MLRKVTRNLAFGHALIGFLLVFFAFDMGRFWGVIASAALVACAIVVNGAAKGTSRLRGSVIATGIGITALSAWAGFQASPWGSHVWGLVLGLGWAILCNGAWYVYFTKRLPFEMPSGKNVSVMGAVAAIIAMIFGAVAISFNGASDDFAGPVMDNVNGTQMEVRYASFDEPLVGDGANIASVPVLNDGKGLVTSWGNLYDRTMALSEQSRANVIANANTWNDTTKRMYADTPWMWFPSWADIENNLRHLTGDYRVIALVNVDMLETEAVRLIRERHPELPANLPVVRVKGALINSECGSGDCNASPSPAKQFVDANGQVRVVLTNPVLDSKTSGQYLTNITAAEYGVGLGTECWNGFLGSRELSPQVKQTLTSKAATGNGTTSVTTTAVVTTTSVIPSSSTTTKVTTTTPTGSTTTTTTTTGTTTSTTTTTTTTTGTTTTTTSQTTTTNTTTNTTTTTPPVTTTTQTTIPKDTDTSSYTVIPSAPPATVTGPAEEPTVPSQPAGTTSTDAPAPPDVTAPGATTTEPPSQPTGTFVPDPTTTQTGDVDPDSGAAAVAPQQDPPSHEGQAPAQESAAVVPLAPAPEEPAAAPAPESQSVQAPAAADPPAATQEESVSTSTVSAGAIDNAAASHSTDNGGIVLVTVLSVGAVLGVGTIGGFTYYRRRHPREVPAHKA